MTPTLLETMCARDGEIALWGRHRERLSRSAAAWGIDVNLADIERRLDETICATANAEVRVRLTVAPDGHVDVDADPMPPLAFGQIDVDPVPFAEAGSPLCIHKTTSREHYETRYRAALARGVDETVLVRSDGRVVEGTRTSLWVRSAGRLQTPSLSAGGLPGVMRAHLLSKREAEETDLRVEHLLAADDVLVSNAVIGLVPVRLTR